MLKKRKKRRKKNHTPNVKLKWLFPYKECIIIIQLSIEKHVNGTQHDQNII
jgi:hypothetical protein